MHAAVVNAWGDLPRYQNYDLPEPTSTQVRIKVVSAGFHNLVRSRGAGRHFSVAKTNPPHIPGTDGVGRIVGTGELVYFNSFSTPTGSFAEEINVEQKDVFPLRDSADPDTTAILVNPAMSSWMALTSRASINRGTPFTVAIIGATGVSGNAAVQIAKAIGATKVITIGKPGSKLDATKLLGADETIALGPDADFTPAADVDIVLDYLWGEVSEPVSLAIVQKRKNKNQKLTWIEIGALAGDEMKVSASLLRKANVQIAGCGPGSWSWEELGEQMPKMLDVIAESGMKTDFVVKRLEDVENWWEDKGARILVKP